MSRRSVVTNSFVREDWREASHGRGRDERDPFRNASAWRDIGIRSSSNLGPDTRSGIHWLHDSRPRLSWLVFQLLFQTWTNGVAWIPSLFLRRSDCRRRTPVGWCGVPIPACGDKSLCTRFDCHIGQWGNRGSCTQLSRLSPGLSYLHFNDGTS